MHIFSTQDVHLQVESLEASVSTLQSTYTRGVPLWHAAVLCMLHSSVNTMVHCKVSPVRSCKYAVVFAVLSACNLAAKLKVHTVRWCGGVVYMYSDIARSGQQYTKDTKLELGKSTLPTTITTTTVPSGNMHGLYRNGDAQSLMLWWHVPHSGIL